MVTHTFLQDVESASAGDVHSGSALLLPPPCAHAEQRGQCRHCHKQPWLVAAWLAGAKSATEKNVCGTRALSTSQRGELMSILPQPGCHQSLSSGDSPGGFSCCSDRCPGASDASDAFYILAAGLGLPHPMAGTALFMLGEAEPHPFLCFSEANKHESTWRWTALG